ncbi:MAG TPA: energy transducer TonB [Candidatus Sulfotelmatobacter sp.]|jgi:TonB family protein
MRTRYVSILFLLLSTGFGTAIAQNAQLSAELRRIVRKVNPSYPDIAKRMNLAGTVKVLAIVAADGTVKSVQPMGGSPVLIQAAQDAVYKWKFAPANSETKEPLELRFDPQ